MSDELEKDREVMRVMRKVLTTIVREITPEHKGIKHPLSDATIEDVRQCLGLITAREKELAEKAGVVQEKPYFIDETPSAKVIPMDRIPTRSSGENEEN